MKKCNYIAYIMVGVLICPIMYNYIHSTKSSNDDKP